MASLTKSLASMSLRGSCSRMISPTVNLSKRYASTSDTPGNSTPQNPSSNEIEIETPVTQSSASSSSSSTSSTRETSSIPSSSSSSSKSTTPKENNHAMKLNSSSKSNSFLANLNPSAVIPHNPVPRSPDFPSFFPNPPVHKHINFPTPVFPPVPESEFPERIGLRADQKREDISSAISGLKSKDMRELRRYTVVAKRVVQMTKKGKIPSFLAIIVVGSPERGLVGIGRGRGPTMGSACDAGYHKAIQSMDYVNRFEGRTLWSAGQDMKYKWGATTVIMRARPAGFGLMVPPVIHRVLTCAGIRDCSATIEGSRNPMQVAKAAIQLLHPGANPPGFGSGVGGKGRREDKRMGMRSKDEIEIERGRYGIDVGRRV